MDFFWYRQLTAKRTLAHLEIFFASMSGTLIYNRITDNQRPTNSYQSTKINVVPADQMQQFLGKQCLKRTIILIIYTITKYEKCF